MTEARNPNVSEMVGSAIEEAIEHQPPEHRERLRALFFAGDWSLRSLGGHKYAVKVGDDELLEVTAGGPFAGMAELYQRQPD